MKHKRLLLIVIILALWINLSFVMVAAQDDARDDNDRGTPTAIVWSPDSQIIAVGSTGGVTLFTNDFEEIAYLTGHSNIITSLSWSPDGQYLASAGKEGTVRVWDVATGEVVTIFTEHSPNITSIAWNPVNNLIVSGAFDRTAKVWDAMTSEIVRILPGDMFDETSGVRSVCWISDGETLVVSAARQVFTWHRATDNIRLILDGISFGESCSPNDTRLAGIGNVVSNINSGETLLRLDHLFSEFTFSLRWSPDGERIAGNDAGAVVLIWDAMTGEVLATLQGGMFEPHNIGYWDSIAWSPDGTMLGATGQDGAVRIWDAETYELLAIYDQYSRFSGDDFPNLFSSRPTATPVSR